MTNDDQEALDEPEVETTTAVAVLDKDAQGLTLQERRLLQEIALSGDFKKAASSMGLTAAAVRRLLRTSPSFKAQFDKVFSVDNLESTESELKLAVQDVAEIFNEAKNAVLTRHEDVDCPACGNHFKISVKVSDWATRLRAAETLAKITRLWKDHRSVEVKGQVNVVHLTLVEQMAYEALQSGKPIPPHVYAQLQRYDGLTLPPNGGGGPVINAEFKEVTDGDEI